jgi:5-methylcytosine-specific restriction endonuclease McrA
MSNKIPEEVRKAVYKRDDYKCRNCHTTKYLELHHIIFRSQGGKDIEENLVTLCNRCHRWAHKYRDQRLKWEKWIKQMYEGGFNNGN